MVKQLALVPWQQYYLHWSRLVYLVFPTCPGLGWQLKALPVCSEQSLGDANALFGFDYLGPLQNYLERDAVSKW